MRKLLAVVALILTVIFIVLLDRPLGTLPALGRLLDPINGCWASAEPVSKKFNLEFSSSGVNASVTVWFDDRLVPHIKAQNDNDLYYVQGYVHAYFRLWQMDLQTRAAAGRVSEILGEKALKFDREQRRKGMGYAAENSLKAMEAEPRTGQMLDAYTAGVNHFISGLTYQKYPLEYKLIGFSPEPWTNLKSALLLKYMADDLTGYTEDIPLTVLKGLFKGDGTFDMLFPERVPGSTPVIPAGTQYGASMQTPAAPPDSMAFVELDAADFEKEEENEGKGSNNWAVSGARTQSGKAILSNDPHLGLNLPSLWFEVQLQSPGLNVYGASLPGAPGVVIGFNDKISWGFTNNYRDVKDFYVIDEAGNGYYNFEGRQLPYSYRIEKIGVKGKADFIDTVRYTLHGPVMYEERFHGPGGLKRPTAMCWMAHKGTNELLSLYMLNRSTNYPDFAIAIQYFQCPAQNIAYADKEGNIALWGQGQFVNKWKGQGRYVMNGSDSSTLWKELIPMSENPHVLNPPQGYVSSANQSVTDSTYPYYYNGYFYEFRAWRINQVLSKLQRATVNDMFALQNDTYSVLAATVLPVLLKYLPVNMTPKEQAYANMLRNWNYQLSVESKAASVFQAWWLYVHNGFVSWKDIPDNLKPSAETVMQVILKIDATPADSLTTAYKQRMAADIPAFFRKAADTLNTMKDGIEWYKVKNTSVNHLTKLPAFSFPGLKIGGWGNTVNAAKSTHGPSWRMVVHMDDEIEAYGVYPGGQSGNPGSRYYASFLGHWVEGKYYRLLFLPSEISDKPAQIKYTWVVKHK